jgi:hypothetical protein
LSLGLAAIKTAPMLTFSSSSSTFGERSQGIQSAGVIVIDVGCNYECSYTTSNRPLASSVTSVLVKPWPGMCQLWMSD